MKNIKIFIDPLVGCTEKLFTQNAMINQTIIELKLEPPHESSLKFTSWHSSLSALSIFSIFLLRAGKISLISGRIALISSSSAALLSEAKDKNSGEEFVLFERIGSLVSFPVLSFYSSKLLRLIVRGKFSSRRVMTSESICDSFGMMRGQTS
jgi:hypothetical protein